MIAMGKFTTMYNPQLIRPIYAGLLRVHCIIFQVYKILMKHLSKSIPIVYIIHNTLIE